MSESHPDVDGTVYLAHSQNAFGRCHPLREHLLSARRLASERARETRWSAEAALAALLHDLGKLDAGRWLLRWPSRGITLACRRRHLESWPHASSRPNSIRRAQILEKPAREVTPKTVDSALGPGYGIFAGRRLKWATLRFTPERARWVAAEHWHHKQRGRFEADGHYLLEIPYADHRELQVDILKYGAEVEVVGPVELRDVIAAQVEKLGRLYFRPTTGSRHETGAVQTGRKRQTGIADAE